MFYFNPSCVREIKLSKESKDGCLENIKNSQNEEKLLPCTVAVLGIVLQRDVLKST